MGVSREVSFRRYENGRPIETGGAVVHEGLVRLHVNGVEWASMMATPQDLDALALGFLTSEGIISGPAEVRRIVVCPSRTCVEVWLKDAGVQRPPQMTVTSGCGGGVTFADLLAEREPLTSDLRVTVRQLGGLLLQLQQRQRIRGCHSSALADGESLLVISEDVGRHNTLDKLYGRCLIDGIQTEGRILLTTGRISSEMLNKAARMQTPVVASRSSPTTLSIALAAAWNVTLVGYVRRDSLNVYAGLARVTDDREEVRIDAHP